MRFLQAIVMGAALLCASSAAAKTIVLDVSGVLAPNDILHASFTPEQNRLYEIKAVFSQQPTDLVAYTDMEWSRYNYLYFGHTFLWGNNYDDYQNIEFIDGRFVAVRLPTRRTTATGFSDFYLTRAKTFLDFHFSGDDPVSYHLQVALVPEPGAWALMILGFGSVGAALRRRRPSTHLEGSTA